MGSLTIQETGFRGLAVVQSLVHADKRGSFYRTFCVQELATSGLPFALLQSSIATNRKRHTLRGLHFQKPPHDESKLVRCIAGAIYDVVVDLRKDEPTFGRWFAVELNEESATGLLIPAGMAHGFCTLRDDTKVLYMMDAVFVPGAGSGVRWDDPALGIDWPCVDPVLSDADASWPDLSI